jgi:hypothetical protein
MNFYRNEFVLNSNGVDLIFHPITFLIQVGMGGEWWSGRLNIGTNVLKHRKEELDEGYRPVIVVLKELEDFSLEIQVSGGFGMDARFMIGENFPKNDYH